MALQIVSNAIASRTFISEDGIEGGSFDVLMRGTYGARIVSAELKDVECPLIALSRYEHFKGTGRLIEMRGELAAEVEFSVIAEGRARRVLGAAVALPGGVDVRLPLGFFQAPVVPLH